MSRAMFELAPLSPSAAVSGSSSLPRRPPPPSWRGILREAMLQLVELLLCAGALVASGSPSSPRAEVASDKQWSSLR
eukprot:6329091-Alexandrium_andersonii.AAC.1